MRASILAAVALLSAGCAQTLTVRVLRYDVAANEPSQARYSEARRTARSVGQARAQVVDARAALLRYKACIRAMNVLVQALQIDADAAAAGTARSLDAIDSAFRDTESALADAEAMLGKQPADAPAPPLDRVPLRFSDLFARLKQPAVETEPARVRKGVATFQQVESPAYRNRGKQVARELEAVLADTSMSCAPAALQQTLAQLNDGKASRAGAARDPFGTAVENTTVQLVTELERVRTGDLIPRPYGVWQDLTDPYLMYIVAHPEQWRELVQSTSVDGQGDTEYVLVFESPLDARLKTVTVDPTQVIQARLAIARKVSQAAIAAAGIATAAYGVPLPTGAKTAPGPGSGAMDTIDYSRMTGDEQVMRERNAAEQRRLERLKEGAARLKPVTDVPTAERALEFLQRELDLGAQGSNPPSS